MNSKNTVIHHSADYDGLFCREIAKRFLPLDTTFIGWDFKDPKIPMPLEGTVYILDLSPDCLGFPELLSNPQMNQIVWIDHHKSSIEKWSQAIAGYRIDGVSACRLAWQWFNHDNNRYKSHHLPDKQDYLDRMVSEPLAVRLAGEYDIWDHRGDGDIEFQFGLDAQACIDWDFLLGNINSYTQQIVQQGAAAMACYSKRDADVMRTRSFLQKFEGLTFLCLNTARCNSQTFKVRDVPETGHDALMAFYWDGKAWNFSLYHAAHRTDIDLSILAKVMNGGGHRGACGFRSDRFPFILPATYENVYTGKSL
jgi:hypothetical protein